MPYYHESTFPNVPDAIPTVATTLVPTITGSQHVANWPVLSFGFSASPSNPALPVQKFYSSDLSTTASLLSHFDWAFYGFNSGNFVHTIRNRDLPFRIVWLPTRSNGHALPHVPLSCPALLPFLITYVDPVSHPNSWAISFTCIATTVASSPKSFGTSRLTLLPNSGSFNPYQFL